MIVYHHFLEQKNYKGWILGLFNVFTLLSIGEMRGERKKKIEGQEQVLNLSSITC
jgi:hypothetical protein